MLLLTNTGTISMNLLTCKYLNVIHSQPGVCVPLGVLEQFAGGTQNVNKLKNIPFWSVFSLQYDLGVRKSGSILILG